MTFTEPRLDHPLLDLADQLERHTDRLVVAIDDEAVAENAYRRAHAVAFTRAAVEGVAATMRSKHADAVPEVVEALCGWNLAGARVKACRVKCDELAARLGAAQSYFRLVGAQT